MRPNITALKQLRRVVENAPDDLLHMRKFRESSSCGTARCAAAWATIDPWFIERGLTSGTAGFPSYKGSSASEATSALMKFFRLTREQAQDLFALTISCYSVDPHAISKRQVLTQIDRLLRGEPTKPYRVKYT
jgi:hypothetical protein